MARVKLELLKNRYEPELSIGEHVEHNSYYLPRREKRSTKYKEYHTYEEFGYSLLDTVTELRRQLDKEDRVDEENRGEKHISYAKKRVLTKDTND